MAGILVEEATGSYIVFDGVMSEVEELSNKVTAHPVGRAGDFTDHIQTEASTLALNVRVTKTPHATTAERSGAAVTSTGDQRVRDTTQWLRDRQGRTFRWSGLAEYFPRLALKSARITTDAPGHIVLALSFTQIRVGSTTLVDIETARKRDAELAGVDPNGGSVSEATTEELRRASILATGESGAADLLGTTP